MSSARRETTIDNEILKAIPTVRSYNALVVVVPGVVTNLNDTVVGTATTQFPIHGGRNNEGRMTIDGLNIGNPPGGNQPPAYVADVGNAEEVTFSTSGGLGESETGGLTMNVVPEDRRQPHLRIGVLQRHQRQSAVEEGVVRPGADAVRLHLRPQRRRRRPHQAGQDLVLRQRPHAGQQAPERNQFFNLNAGDATKWLYARG